MELCLDSDVVLFHFAEVISKRILKVSHVTSQLKTNTHRTRQFLVFIFGEIEDAMQWCLLQHSHGHYPWVFASIHVFPFQKSALVLQRAVSLSLDQEFRSSIQPGHKNGLVLGEQTRTNEVIWSRGRGATTRTRTTPSNLNIAVHGTGACSFHGYFLQPIRCGLRLDRENVVTSSSMKTYIVQLLYAVVPRNFLASADSPNYYVVLLPYPFVRVFPSSVALHSGLGVSIYINPTKLHTKIVADAKKPWFCFVKNH